MAVTRSLLGPLTQAGLHKILYNAYGLQPRLREKAFNVQVYKDGGYVEWTGVTGALSLPQVKPEGVAMVEVDPAVLTPIRVEMQTLGMKFRETLEARQDNRYRVLRNLAALHGEAFAIREETDGANALNIGTVSIAGSAGAGYDGLPLFSASHTLSAGSYGSTRATTDLSTVPAKTTMTWSNLLTPAADFDFVSYDDLLVLIRRTPNHQGNYISMQPQYLWHPPELEVAVNEVLRSTTRPDTANRADNVLKQMYPGVQGMPWSYLLDADAWGISCTRHDLQWFERMPLTVQTKDAADSTWDVLHEAVIRYGRGFHDPRGWAWSQGLA